jgi:hypothetical protein
MNTEISASRIDRLARALPIELCFADSYSKEKITWLEERFKTPIYDWLSRQIPPLAEVLARHPQEAAIRLECFDNLKGPNDEPVHLLILFALEFNGKATIKVWIGPPEEVAKKTKILVTAFGPSCSAFG